MKSIALVNVRAQLQQICLLSTIILWWESCSQCVISWSQVYLIARLSNRFLSYLSAVSPPSELTPHTLHLTLIKIINIITYFSRVTTRVTYSPWLKVEIVLSIVICHITPISHHSSHYIVCCPPRNIQNIRKELRVYIYISIWGECISFTSFLLTLGSCLGQDAGQFIFYWQISSSVYPCKKENKKSIAEIFNCQ